LKKRKGYYMISSFSKLRIYLPGPMESCRDTAADWRNDIKPRLVALGFNEENIVDPVKRQPEGEYEAIDRARAIGNWADVDRITGEIVNHDLRFVDLCDFLICHLFEGVLTCGTWDEIFMASQQRKPVFIIMKDWREKAPSWLFGRFGHAMMHEDIDEVVNRLRNIRDGMEPPPEGWRNLYDRTYTI